LVFISHVHVIHDTCYNEKPFYHNLMFALCAPLTRYNTPHAIKAADDIHLATLQQIFCFANFLFNSTALFRFAQGWYSRLWLISIKNVATQIYGSTWIVSLITRKYSRHLSKMTRLKSSHFCSKFTRLGYEQSGG